MEFFSKESPIRLRDGDSDSDTTTGDDWTTQGCQGFVKGCVLHVTPVLPGTRTGAEGKEPSSNPLAAGTTVLGTYYIAP